MSYNLAQTFYVDPNKVNGASFIYLTSINLYFSAKPNPSKTVTGIYYPGVQIYICKTINGNPDLTSVYQNSYSRVEYDSINATGSPGTPTSFRFKLPIAVATGTQYAILIVYDDPNFTLWEATIGDRVFGTNNPFTGVPNFQGNLYTYSNSGNWVPQASSQLVFDVKIAQFTSNNLTVQLTDKNNEFITYSNTFSSFMGGETVFVQNTPVTGTVSTLALSNNIYQNTVASFTNSVFVGDAIVITSGNTNIVANAIAVNSSVITLDTTIPFTNASATYYKSVIGVVFNNEPLTNTVYLTSSTANSTYYFSPNSTIVGAISGTSATIQNVFDINVHQFMAQILAYTPSNGYSNLSYNFAYANVGGGYAVNSNNYLSFLNGSTESIDSYNALLLSRSNEVRNSNSLFTGGKSAIFVANIGINQSNSGLFQSPMLYNEKIDIFVSNNIINSNTNNENTTYGSALAKHITSTVTFVQGYNAENIFAKLTVYKPVGTDVQLYAKIQNSNDNDAFNSKDWTLLSANGASNVYSQGASNSDYVTLTFGLPPYPPSLYKANGTVTVTSGNSTILGSGTNFGTEILPGDVVKVYSPLFTNNYFVASVLSVTNTTALVLDQSFTNSSITTSQLFIDKIATPHTAFINPQNGNICRYYDSKLGIQDTYSTMKFKIDLLSSNASVVPRVSSIQVVATSA